MGTIAQEISRIQTAKANLKTSIENKGVTVPSNTLISGYPALVDQITGGGGGGVTIPSYDIAGYLFNGGRFTGIETDLLNAYVGTNCSDLYRSTLTQETAKGSVVSAFIEKSITNAATIDANTSIQASYMTYSNPIDATDNDVNVDISATNFPYNRTKNIGLSNLRAKSSEPFNNITLNFIPTNSQYHPRISSSLYVFNFNGNFRIYSYYYSSSLRLFNGTFTTGYLYEFHLIPENSSSILELHNMYSSNPTFIDENTLIRSINLYTASEMTDKTLTIVLPDDIYNNLQQSTIDAATAVNISFTTYT